jgi:predicted dehydrogenase
MADLMDTIASGKDSEAGGADNLKTMALVEAGYQSLRERRSVPITEVAR